jgi:error-prone DNA polymerase
VFYVESPATRQLLTKMRRGDYENLVIASSIIRPAANKYIRIFVKRLHGAPYRPLHPLIEGTLAETFGVMVYQEDVSRVAIDLAGFPIEEADGLRKVLSKKNRALRLPDFRERFFRGGAARGVSVEVLEKVWDMILSFDGYSFCKAHSASYAQVSYRLAYIKRFFPLEFIASVINNGGGFYSRQTYVDEARRMGFRILPPDVNKSGWEYTVEALPPDDAASRPSAGLRVGLGQLRDFARPLMERILAERGEGGPFLGFGDFLARVSPRAGNRTAPRAGNRTAPRAGNRTNARRAPRLGFSDLRVLIRSGALDSISEGCTRPQLFFRFHNEGGECGLGLAPPAPPLVGDYPEGVKLRDEAETLGLVISRHPLSLFRARIRRMVARYGLSPVLSSSAEIPEWKGKRVWISGILVTGKEVVTRKREQMIFVSFEDEEAVFETVLFPDAFERLSALLDQGWAFLILGRVEEDLGALAISVENLVRVSRGAEDAEEIVPSSPGRAASPRVFFWGYGETEEPRPVGEAGPLLSR